MANPVEFSHHPWGYTKNPPTVKGFCRKVADGDTCDAFMDLGFGKYAYETLRLNGFDAPELLKPRNEAELLHATQAWERLQGLLLNKQIRVTSYRDATTYGRYVADIYYLKAGTWIDVTATMRAAGFAKRASYD